MGRPRVIKSGKSQWQPVAIDPTVFNSNDLDGLIGIEELTDYSIGGIKQPKKSKGKVENTKSTTDVSSSVVEKEKLKKKKRPKKKKKNVSLEKTSPQASTETTAAEEIPEISSPVTESNELSLRLPLWNGLGVPPVLLQALADKSFSAPTKIQALTLPPAIFGRRDILGAAETGSGKTLAFGLPILTGILQEMKNLQNESEADDDDEDDDTAAEELSVDSFNEDDEVDDDENNDVDNELDDDENNDVDNELDDDEEDEDKNNDVDNELGDDEDVENNDVDNELDDDEDSHSDAESSNDEAEDLDNLDGTAQCVKVIDNIECDFPVTGRGSSKSKYIRKPLYALILTPTRELAVQISQHLKTAAKYTNIAVSVVVGGLALQKQERLLNRGPEIIVATPGRLWELIEEGHPHLSQLDNLKYLAIDETDRMLEKGHFEELQRILEKVNENETSRKKRQNFVFSATLTLTHEPPRYILKKGKKKGKGKTEPTRLTPAQKLASIMKTVGLSDPKIVDITDSSGVAQLLTEAQIICTLDEKDLYLYYFLQRHPGRTLVFCNSIEAVRRLTQLFTILDCSPLALHAKMHQKQRLKNLERFCSNPRAVLLATDVAARGLDIPNVQHVIHYQTPRTAEGYVHRSGRTARAQQEGLTVLLVEPSEASLLTRLLRTLGRDSSLPSFPVEAEWMPSVKQRVDLARRLDKLELQARRINTEHGWFDKLVKEMDIEISDEELPTSYSREGGDKVKKQAAVYRKQLAILLSKPLFPKNFSSKYLTQTGKLVVPLFPGSQSTNEDHLEGNAVQVLKQSVEQEKAQKRKRNNERSKRNKKNKRRKKKEASVDEQLAQTSGEESGVEDNS